MGNDVSFGFDPTPFLRGLNRVSQGMGRMTKEASSAAKNIGKSMFKAQAAIELIKVALRAVGKMLRQVGAGMPEIGKAFSVAKDIIMKNLLWPLRQQVAPLLQRMLDWVRDNRTTFAKWGQVVANVFRVAITAIQKTIEGMQKLGSFLGKIMRDLFGFVNRDISDVVNLIIAKIAVAITFLGVLIQKVADFFVDTGLAEVFAVLLENTVLLIQRAAELATAFGEGMASKFEMIKDATQGLSDALLNLMDAIFGDGEGMERAKEIMRSFGEIMGTVVAVGLDTAAAVIDRLAERIRTIKEAIGDGRWMDALKNLPVVSGVISGVEGFREGREGGEGFLGAMGTAGRSMYEDSFLEDMVNSAKTRFGGDEQQDFLMRPGQAPVAFSEDDTIIGTKGGLPGGAQVNIDMSGAQFTVTEGNAQSAGENFANGLGTGLRRQLQDAMSAEGY